MEYQIIKNDQHPFLELTYDPEQNWIYANWIGYISHASIETGAQALLKLISETQCPYLLNDNRQVLGPWDKSNCYLEQEVLPAFMKAGLRYFAHILSPAISGALSAQDLHRRLCHTIYMKLFGDAEKARNWLRECQAEVLPEK